MRRGPDRYEVVSVAVSVSVPVAVMAWRTLNGRRVDAVAASFDLAADEIVRLVQS